eukprot:62223-Rhodomonas_salina.1
MDVPGWEEDPFITGYKLAEHVPGYTGFIPRLQNNFAHTFTTSTRIAMSCPPTPDVEAVQYDFQRGRRSLRTPNPLAGTGFHGFVEDEEHDTQPLKPYVQVTRSHSLLASLRWQVRNISTCLPGRSCQSCQLLRRPIAQGRKDEEGKSAHVDAEKKPHSQPFPAHIRRHVGFLLKPPCVFTATACSRAATATDARFCPQLLLFWEAHVPDDHQRVVSSTLHRDLHFFHHAESDKFNRQREKLELHHSAVSIQEFNGVQPVPFSSSVLETGAQVVEDICCRTIPTPLDRIVSLLVRGLGVWSVSMRAVDLEQWTGWGRGGSDGVPVQAGAGVGWKGENRKPVSQKQQQQQQQQQQHL